MNLTQKHNEQAAISFLTQAINRHRERYSQDDIYLLMSSALNSLSGRQPANEWEGGKDANS
jgi:hypothetical protein